MAIAAALWGAERAVRFARLARINALLGKRQTAPLVDGRPYHDAPGSSSAYGPQEIKQAPVVPYNAPFTDKTLPRSPGETPGAWAYAETPITDIKQPSQLGYYNEGSLQPLGSREAQKIDPYTSETASRPSTSTLVSGTGGGYSPVHAHERKMSDMASQYNRKESFATMPLTGRDSIPVAPPIPIGYAQAQLLPSRTIRLTIRVAHPFEWAPGQHVLLYLPEISRFQSHPFTITNNGQSEIVLLVKARKGITRQLFDLVRTRSLAAVGLNGATDKRLSLSAMRGGEGNVQVPPVYVRAWVDGPLGSSARTKWGDYSSILIICGGSGISFGVSICDYICRTMAQGRTTARFQTQRIRLCWVVREYGESPTKSIADQ